MGLALDEPGADDRAIEAEGFRFVIAEREADIVFSEGRVHVDYRSHPWGGGFIVRAIAARSCC